MNYWALTPVMHSPELKLEHKQQIASLGRPGARMSEDAMIACRDLTSKLPACTSLVVICSENAPMRRVYLRRPTREDWITLERGGFITVLNNFGFMMDALH